MKPSCIVDALLENDDLRRLAQGAGILPPYSDVTRVLAKAKHFPEYKRCKYDFSRRGFTRVDFIEFEGKQEFRDPQFDPYFTKPIYVWRARLQSRHGMDDRPGCRLDFGAERVRSVTGKEHEQISDEHPVEEVNDFIQRLKQIARITYIYWGPGNVEREIT